MFKFKVRTDLVDCSIDICSPDVLDIYKEGFQEKRINFIKEDILADEVMDYKMNCHILKNEYACRVSNLRSYEQVTSEIIKRWVYPIVPETITGGSDYHRTRDNNYFHKHVKLERSCFVDSNPTGTFPFYLGYNQEDWTNNPLINFTFTPCKAGYTSLNYLNPCIPCETGSYKPTDGIYECLLCSENTFQNETKSLSCLNCPENRISLKGTKRIQDCVCDKGLKVFLNFKDFL